MTDFADALERAGWSQADFARVTRVHVVTVNVWAQGKREPPFHVQLLADLIAENPSLSALLRQKLLRAPELKRAPSYEKARTDRLERWVEREFGERAR